MTEHRKQAEFLKTLMQYDDNPDHRVLLERLSTAERNEHCLVCACRLVAVVAFLGAAGIGYSAVLLPEFFDNATHIIVHFFSALGLGSLMCLGVFLGLWFWYRGVVNRIHEGCRRAIVSMVDARLRMKMTTFSPIVMEAPHQGTGVTVTAHNGNDHGTDFWSLPKAS